MEIFKKWLSSMSRGISWLIKSKYGRRLSIFWRDCKICIRGEYCTGILSVLIYSRAKEYTNLGISMYPRLTTKAISYAIPRLEHHIMQAPKYGGTNPMILEVTYGHLDVSYMKWQPWSLRSMVRTCRTYSKMFNEVRFLS